MATTKKSTKAKTKTAAARSAKTSRTTVKNASARTTKKAAPAAASKVAQTQPSQLLTRLQAFSAFVSVAAALAAAFLVSTRSYELVTGLIAKDELASKAGSNVYVPAVTHIYDLPLRWALVGGFLLTAVTPLLILTVQKVRYANALKAKVNALRWIDVAIISAFTIEIVALLSGINDILVLKVLAGLMVVTCALSWIAEKRNIQANRPVKSELIVSVATGILPWILLGGYAVGTFISGRIASPWYVYVLYAVLAAGFVGYCLNLKSFVWRKVTDYQLVERNFVMLSILIKVAFAAILIAGLRK